ncbi:hypothetical protein J2T57_003497 [Natronocella acetinitrilica]|uniref:Outer membrane protein beta-barrel domain-containing protein n=1 Tax=Natronocella acetinitrilica TaxID=414046 RepID=A0AAE3G5Q5_9GAMM|nr:porin family protein [Natronocella acetinitrilica]MCP1676336.1 hypothetical protein [Natronocella acetinitrilica]
MGSLHRHLKHTAMATGLLAVSLAGPAQAQSQGNLYLGVDLHGWSFSPDRGSNWRDFGVRGKFGGRIAENFAIEAHAATGGSDRSNGATLELDYLMGLFVRGDIPITRYTSLYGLVGFSELKYTLANDSDRDSSVSFGFGGDFQVSNNTSLNIDWIRYINETDYDYSALSLGARWRF